MAVQILGTDLDGEAGIGPPDLLEADPEERGHGVPGHDFAGVGHVGIIHDERSFIRTV